VVDLAGSRLHELLRRWKNSTAQADDAALQDSCEQIFRRQRCEIGRCINSLNGFVFAITFNDDTRCVLAEPSRYRPWLDRNNLAR